MEKKTWIKRKCCWKNSFFLIYYIVIRLLNDSFELLKTCFSTVGDFNGIEIFFVTLFNLKPKHHIFTGKLKLPVYRLNTHKSEYAYD